MNKNITVLGAGSWGTALACLLARNGHQIKLWEFFAEKAKKIIQSRENSEYLPGVAIPEDLLVTHEIEKCLPGAEIIVIATHSTFVRETMERVKPFLRENQIIVITTKGIEEQNLLRLSEVVFQYTNSPIVALSGPSHAEEVSCELPATCVAASTDIAAAEAVQDIFMNSRFRVYTNTDLIGVELGGALKNVIALASGINDGLGYGDNSRAALITRGMSEIARLGAAMGGNPSTFSGLAGIGDLIVTCTSRHSRNYRTGMLLGKGYTLPEALLEVKTVVEGVNTAKSALRLAEKYNVEMPITAEINKILYEGKNPEQAVNDLMNRDKKTETAETP